MASLANRPVANDLLDGLPREIRLELLNSCDRIDLSVGTILCDTRRPQSHVYFPLDSIISLFAVTNGSSLGVALIGNEGVMAIPQLLGRHVSPLRAVVAKSGSALRMQAAPFRRMLVRNKAFRRACEHSLYALITQVAQIAACTCFHVLDARLARHLLMFDDRVRAGNFYLTQTMLAGSLGVRRSGVTASAAMLQRRKLIHYIRGDFTILDRIGMEKAACGCYRKLTIARNSRNS